MNTFDYSKSLATLMTPEVMDAVAAIHEYRAKESLYQTVQPDSLKKLEKIAIIQSTEASNAIEGISTSTPRLRALMADKVEPVNRDEREIAGYRRVLDLIHSSYNDIPFTPQVILQLHRDLYSFQNLNFAGRWKDTDNVIAERTASGELRTRFVPTSAVATPGAIESLCNEYARCVSEHKYDELLVIALAVFDFVSVHPFNDGNGRMSRLLLLLLLYKSGYSIGKYISLEKQIELTKATYYEALGASSAGWESGSNDYLPFVTYLLGTILVCYKELDERILAVDESPSNEELVLVFLRKNIVPASKREILEGCPSLSQRTLERVLSRLMSDGRIEKHGAARSTAYALRSARA